MLKSARIFSPPRSTYSSVERFRHSCEHIADSSLSLATHASAGSVTYICIIHVLWKSLGPTTRAGTDPFDRFNDRQRTLMLRTDLISNVQNFQLTTSNQPSSWWADSTSPMITSLLADEFSEFEVIVSAGELGSSGFSFSRGIGGGDSVPSAMFVLTVSRNLLAFTFFSIFVILHKNSWMHLSLERSRWLFLDFLLIYRMKLCNFHEKTRLATIGRVEPRDTRKKSEVDAGWG